MLDPRLLRSDIEETAAKLLRRGFTLDVAAYNELRDVRAEAEYGMPFTEMEANYKDVNWPGNKVKLKEKIDQIKVDYPQKLSEVQ